MSPSGTRRHIKRWAATALIVAGVVSGVVYSVVGPDRGRVTVLSLVASTDLGALPARGTGAGQFCGEVGTLGTPEHCYLLQEAAGDLADEVGGLTLTAAGTPRYSVPSGLPVQGAAIAWDEVGIASDSSGYFTAIDTVAAVASITVIWRTTRTGATQQVFDWGSAAGAGYRASAINTGEMYVYANFGTGVAAVPVGWTKADDGAAHCGTFSFNHATWGVWIDGTAYTATPTGDYGNTTNPVVVAILSNFTGGALMKGSILRFRVDHAAATLADHQALCGEYTKPLRTTHLAYADSTFSGGTGGARCFPMSATSAVCLPGSAAGYGWDGTAVGWAFEDARTNRLLYNSQINCVNWTCSGLGAELLADGDMEINEVCAPSCTNWKAWNAVDVLTKETAAPHGGLRNLKVAYGGTGYPKAYQTPTIAGKAYTSNVWTKGSCSIFETPCSGGGAWALQSVTRIATSIYYNLQANVTGVGYAEFDDASLKEVFPTITAAVAPDGSLTAAAVAFDGAETLSKAAAGYTAATTVYPTMWVKCAAGTLSITNTTGTGDWDVDCTHATLNGSWARIHATHAAVTVNAAWESDGAGAVTPTFAGTDFSLWLPTLTEVAGDSVIPTLAAAVTTSDQAWTIANSAGQYHRTSDTIIDAPTTYDAACFVAGTTLRLTGAVGSECTSSLRSLEIRR